MVKKKITYSFTNFVLGKYRMSDNVLNNLFNTMTSTEKNMILVGDLRVLWRMVYSGNANPTYRSRTMFKNFMSIGEKKRRSLMNGTKNIEYYWEFPKGRKNDDEDDLTCALREFEEETHVPATDVRVTGEPISALIESNDVYYTYKLFMAEYVGDDGNVNVFNASHNCEVQDVKWLSQSECTVANINRQNRRVLSKVFTTLIDGQTLSSSSKTNKPGRQSWKERFSEKRIDRKNSGGHGGECDGSQPKRFKRGTSTRIH